MERLRRPLAGPAEPQRTVSVGAVARATMRGWRTICVGFVSVKFGYTGLNMYLSGASLLLIGHCQGAINGEPPVRHTGDTWPAAGRCRALGRALWCLPP